MGIRERWRRYQKLPHDVLVRVECLAPLLVDHRVELAYLFGSLAAEGRGQDVDLALLVDGGPEPLRRHIEKVLGTDRLDLVDLATASPVMKMEVMRTGVLILEESGERHAAFAIRTLREFHDTEYLRACQREVLESRMKAWS